MRTAVETPPSCTHLEPFGPALLTGKERPALLAWAAAHTRASERVILMM